MKPFSLNFFSVVGKVDVQNGHLVLDSNRKVPISNGVPRFSPDSTYVDGNFRVLREKYATIQLDSINGTKERLNLILERTGWPASFFKDKFVLECGCGAGPDTEILLQLGAKVIAADLSVDAANKNLGTNPNVQFIQADITNLPLKKMSFDIVFCHRVLQHTPDPEKTLKHIVSFLKDDGAIFIHSYADTFYQKFRWKYWLLPITRKFNPDFLYKLIEWYAKPAYYFTKLTSKSRLGSRLNWTFIPFLNHCRMKKYSGMPDDFFIEHGIHDTFDALSPTFDKPISTNRLKEIAQSQLKHPFEIEEAATVTLLRSKVDRG